MTNGIEVEHRPGRGPAIVLVHGNSSSRAVWRPLMDHLGDREVLAMDLRGHGASAWVRPPDYSTAGYADDIARAVERLAGHGFVLVGHSNGALAAAYYAANLEPKPKALVYIDISPSVPESQVSYFRQRAANVDRVWTSLEKLTATMSAADPTVPTHAWLAYLSEFAEPVEGGMRQMLDPMTFGAWAPADVWQDLRSLAMPLYLVRGATSRVLSPEVADQMRARLPRARFYQIDGAGHFLMLAKPRHLAAVIEEVVLDVEAVGARDN
jgi:2-(acetamidomethylene)succinate hydrolase